MELKHGRYRAVGPPQGLLIVPYGIETIYLVNRLFFDYLLIVPYGIETFNNISLRSQITLLIVPYGIETRQKRV